MKKILMISTHFAPDAHVGAKRVTQFAKNLPKFGWQPVILTKAISDYDHMDGGLNNEIIGINIIRVKQRRLTKRKKNELLGMVNKAKSKKLNLIKQIVSYLNLYMNFDYGWLIPAFFKAIKLVKVHDIKIVYASSPNPDSLMIGYLLKKIMRIKLVCDYRDPWTERPYLNLPKARMWLDDLLEKTILKSSDLVVTTGKVLNEELIKRYALRHTGSFKVIYNGYDKELIGTPIQSSRHDGKFKIVFWGIWKWFITPEYFLRGLAIFLKRKEYMKNRICVEFLGRIEGIELLNITRRLLKELNLERVVKLTDFMSYRDGINILFDSDVLLLIVPPYNGFTRYRVPAKLFEYMYVQKPIMSLVPLNGECAQLIRRLRIGKFSDPEDVEAIAELIGDMYIEFKNGFPDYKPVLNEIEKFDRVVLTKRLTEYLTAIL